MNLTCCDNIRLETMGDRKTALFLIIPATDSTYNFLVAMLYTQMFDVLANRANFKYGGMLPVHVRCVMDEFANIGQIPDFDKVIAFVRSMGMSLNVIIQNLAQLKARYEKNWEVITGNCDSLLFLGGQEESTLKYISEALGKETIDVRGHNRTKGKSPSTSENNSILGRELMQPNEVATMPISDCIVRIRSHNPFYCTKYPIEKHPNFKFLEDYDKKNAFDVKTVHAVTLREFTQQNIKKQPVEIKDLNTENQEQDKKIETIFSKNEVSEIEFETYEEAELYADELVSETFSEEYIDEDLPEFGEVSEYEAFDLGKPVRPREEVNEDDEVSTMSEESDIDNTVFYEDPDECAESFEDIAEIADEAIMDCEESYSEDYSDYELPEDDYGMSDEMFEFD